MPDITQVLKDILNELAELQKEAYQQCGLCKANTKKSNYWDGYYEAIESAENKVWMQIMALGLSSSIKGFAKTK